MRFLSFHFYMCKDSGSSKFHGSTASNKEYFYSFPNKNSKILLNIAVLPRNLPDLK